MNSVAKHKLELHYLNDKYRHLSGSSTKLQALSKNPHWTLKA